MAVVQCFETHSNISGRSVPHLRLLTPQTSCCCIYSYYLPLSSCPQSLVPLGLSLLLLALVLPPPADFKFLPLQVFCSFYVCELI